MSEDTPKPSALVPFGSHALAKAPNSQRIATRMAENLLAHARSQERGLASQKRYRIGDYEFCEIDHAQIQIWANYFAITAEDLVRPHHTGLAVSLTPKAVSSFSTVS